MEGWWPKYSIKRHPRAKSVKIRAYSEGLQLTIPVRFNLKHIPDILNENRKWIEKQLAELSEKEPFSIPDSIDLPAFNIRAKVIQHPAQIKCRIYTRPDHEIVLMGELNDLKKVEKSLIKWAQMKAKQLLPDLLSKMSKEIGLGYNEMTIRNQQTRWGSCTSDKNINLNYKIIFLSEELARHVLIHELCHTEVMDHSDQFWQLVAQFDPNWQINRKALKKAGKLLPAWIRDY